MKVHSEDLPMPILWEKISLAFKPSDSHMTEAP